MEVGCAGVHFRECWLAVTGSVGGHVRAAFQNIGDVNIVAFQTHGFDHFGEELAGSADEWYALLVFVGTWGFTDEHERGIGVADAEDDLFAERGEVGAAGAGESGIPEPCKAGGFVTFGKLEAPLGLGLSLG